MPETTTEKSRDGGIHILRIADVREKTGMSISTIYELIAEKKFPRPVRLSARSVGWSRSEVDEWLRARLANRDEEQQRPVVKRRRARASVAA